MASTRTTRKKTGTQRSVGAKKSTKAVKRTPARKADDKRTGAKRKTFVKNEAAAVLAILAALFLLLSGFGLFGAAGSFLFGIEKGLFGLAAYVFPLLIVLLVYLYMMQAGNALFPLKCASSVLLYFMLCAFLQLFAGGEPAEEGYFAASREAVHGIGGGLFGGLISGSLSGAVGSVGTFLILLAVSIVCLVVLTEKSFLEALRSGSDAAGRAFSEGHERYREIREEQRIRAEARREENRLRRKERSFDDQDLNLRKRQETEEGEDLFSVNDPFGTAVAKGKPAAATAAAAAAAAAAGIPEALAAEAAAGPVITFTDIPAAPSVPVPEAAAPSVAAVPAARDRFSEMDRVLSGMQEGNLSLKKETDASGISYGRVSVGDIPVPKINYDDDSVPFEETAEDKHRSLVQILSLDNLPVSAAEQARLAVGHGEASSAALGGAAQDAPVPMEAFRKAPAQDTEVLEPLFDDVLTDIPGISEAPAETISSVFSESPAMPLPAEPEPEELPADLITDPLDEILKDAPDAGPLTEPVNETEPEETPNAEEEDDSDYAEDMKTAVSASGKTLGEVSQYEARETLAGKTVYGLDNRPKEDGEVKTGGKYAGQYAGSAVGNTAKSAAVPGGSVQSAAAADPAAVPAEKPVPQKKPYEFPPVGLLKKGPAAAAASQVELTENAHKLESVLSTFGVGVHVTKVTKGPSVTRYEMIPDMGVKVSRITALEGDIKLALAATDVRIEAPIPGKSAVGIEVPNDTVSLVSFREILEAPQLKEAKAKLTIGIGKDINGQPVVGNLAKMPHLLISGTTGSGKSVGINTLIMSLVYRCTPDEVRLIMVDPKVVELSNYNGLPHLLIPVVTKPDKALQALNWACAEMNQRYKMFAETQTRNISGYNEKVEKVNASLPEDKQMKKMPFIVIIIDELAELMMHSKKEVEAAIVSLTQLARAAGIHLVIATQRPSVDVITGLIKANIPSRIAYKLPSFTDSKTILDAAGAETLLGNGDMLYKPNGANSPTRVQGAYLADDEIEAVMNWMKKHNDPCYAETVDTAVNTDPAAQEVQDASAPGDGRDEYFAEAGRLIVDKQKASIGMLQRMFKIGFNRAARIMDQLCEAGVVGAEEGTKPRRILMDRAAYEEFLNNQ